MPADGKTVSSLAGMSQPRDGDNAGPQSISVSPTKPDRTRLVYLYPLTAVFSSSGSIDDAANFGPGPAKPVDAE